MEQKDFRFNGWKSQVLKLEILWGKSSDGDGLAVMCLGVLLEVLNGGFSLRQGSEYK
jgi:hypothetical protein